MSTAEKLQTIAENEQRVYDAGYAKGQAEGGDTTAAYDEGFEAGKKAEYDAFWDEYQDYGNRGDYALAFAGMGWTANRFNPKYPMNVTYAFEMFRSCGEIDLIASGVNIDFSQCTSFSSMCHSSNIVSLGVIDARNSDNFSYTFYNCQRLTKIEKLILKDDGSQQLGGSPMFDRCGSLIDITIEGVIGADGLNFKTSTKLSKASITSIINALSTTTSGLTVTLSKTAKEAAFTADEWAALIATRNNWTISLV